eukprot:m.927437 g.927437  ORF g.927437 m.927437 type:complete len:348 (-) comp23775_c0_seq5:6256-7299(-)
MSEAQGTSATKRKPRSRVRASNSINDTTATVADSNDGGADSNDGGASVDTAKGVNGEETPAARGGGDDGATNKEPEPDSADRVLTASSRVKSKSKKSRSKKSKETDADKATDPSDETTTRPQAEGQSAVDGRRTMDSFGVASRNTPRVIAPDRHGSLSGVFMATFTGQITTAEFPFHDALSCKYSFKYGKDWQPIAGMEEGLSQVTRRSQDGRNIIVWNFPLEVTFKSTNPFGWPQIIVTVTGLDGLGREVVRGYGAKHLPLGPGAHDLEVPMFVPITASIVDRLVGYLLGTRAEFIDDKFVASGMGREVTRVQSQGKVNIAVSLVMKDFKRFGFRVQPNRSGGRDE